MSSTPQIVLNNITYNIPHSRVHLQDVSLAFHSLKYGIVGDNGSGKTTLMRLLMGDLLPQNGGVFRLGRISYCPQHFDAAENSTVAEILEVDQKLQAFASISQGSADPEYYEILGEDWNIVERVRLALDQAGLIDIHAETLYGHLSGGQKTKLLLAKALVSDADFILLDEPTNNLDRHSRQILYDFIGNASVGIIVISHDRHLLNLMDEIIELSEKGVACFGGNFKHYQEQKSLKTEALAKDLEDAKKAIQKSEKSMQDSREKLEQRRSKGRKLFLSGSIDKLTAGSKRGRSERTQSRLATLDERIISDANKRIENVRDQIEIKIEIDIDLRATQVANGKFVLDCEDLCFSYPSLSKLIFNHFNFKLVGPEHVAITGKNGSGKTTLVKLICGNLQPVTGSINIGVAKIAYLDQKVEFLQKELRLIDNFCLLNPESSINDAYYALAQFGFRNKDAEKQVSQLSGGEKIRAGLAIALCAKPAPQLIILDEPTNHLDLRSIQCIEAALSKFQGAMIVISHDAEFLRNIGIERWVEI